ncbi:hypothetical protein PISL3812_07256 [Talaromyces islandicus]|uniref:Fork-head domain-containing protein n=1 Tax=Talaromyces islandicus TaxID=28573 RepID=A0A0U1M3P2_TALIS|nr:hypothetical protein PISL3812_07256 [Talaromyces islandicus]
MEERKPCYFGQGDIRWQDNEPPSENTMSQPDEVAGSTFEINTYQTANSLFPPESFSNYPDMSLLYPPSTFFPSHEPLGLYTGPSESSLYGNFYIPVWERPSGISRLVENAFPGAYVPFQQPSLSNEYEGYTSIQSDMDYPHISPQVQHVHCPHGSLTESERSTMNIPSTSGNTPSSRVDDTTPLTSVTTHTARTQETSVAQAENDEKPYAYLIYRALLSANKHRLTLQEIYGWFKENTTKANGSSGTSWKSSIRYNLSMNTKGFVSYTELSPSKSKANYWALTEEALHNDERRKNIGKPIYKAPPERLLDSFVFSPQI